MTKKNTNISEIRIEEIHDHEESKHFFRVYFYYESGKIEVMGESNIKPILARNVSKVYWMKNIIKKDKKPKKDKTLKKSNVIDIASSLANIKSKDSNEILVLAPSELDYKPKKCQRCFYLEKNHKIGPKDFPPPVFSRFDVVQQAYYKDKNTSDLTKELPAGRIMNKEELPGRVVSETLTDNKGREFILGGRPDIVIKFDQGGYGIIDFKTTKISDDKSENYK